MDTIFEGSGEEGMGLKLEGDVCIRFHMINLENILK